MGIPLPPVPPLTAKGFADPVWAQWLDAVRRTVITAGTTSSLTASAPLHITGTPQNIYSDVAGAGTSGYLTASDWATFNSKQATLAPADATHDGYLVKADWTTFNNKQPSFSVSVGLQLIAGYLSLTSYPIFQVTLTADQAIAASTQTKVLFDTKAFDSGMSGAGAYFDTTNSRYTPLVAGKHRFTLSLDISNTSAVGGLLQCSFYKNGAINRSAKFTTTTVTVGDLNTVSCTATLQLNGTSDYVEAFAFISGTVNTIKGTVTGSFFEASYLGP